MHCVKRFRGGKSHHTLAWGGILELETHIATKTKEKSTFTMKLRIPGTKELFVECLFC